MASRSLNVVTYVTFTKPNPYTLLQSQPSDWETRWQRYYTKTSSNPDVYTHLSNVTAPTFASNTYYSYAQSSITSNDNITGSFGAFASLIDMVLDIDNNMKLESTIDTDTNSQFFNGFSLNPPTTLAVVDYIIDLFGETPLRTEINNPTTITESISNIVTAAPTALAPDNNIEYYEYDSETETLTLNMLLFDTTAAITTTEVTDIMQLTPEQPSSD